MTYFVLLLAGTLIGIYDTPVKCTKALAQEIKDRPKAVATDLKCEKRTIE